MIDSSDKQILSFNRLAMEWLRKSNIEKSEEYLERAKSLLQSKSQPKHGSNLWAVTLNNFGCLHKRKGEYDLALKYLNSALLEQQGNPKEALNTAGIHLNISAIFSQLGYHEDSLKNALKSKKLLQSVAVKDQNIWVSLIISYHAIGFELEKLGKNENASQMYLKGWELAQDHLGAFHNITEGIKKKYFFLQKKNNQKNMPRSKTPVIMPKSSNVSINEKQVRNMSVVKKFKKSKIITPIIAHRKVESQKSLETLDFLVNELELEINKSESSTEVEGVFKGRVENSIETVSKDSKRKKKIEKESFERKRFPKKWEDKTKIFNKIKEDMRGKGKIEVSVENNKEKEKNEEENIKRLDESEGYSFEFENDSSGSEIFEIQDQARKKSEDLIKNGPILMKNLSQKEEYPFETHDDSRNNTQAIDKSLETSKKNEKMIETSEKLDPKSQKALKTIDIKMQKSERTNELNESRIEIELEPFSKSFLVGESSKNNEKKFFSDSATQTDSIHPSNSMSTQTNLIKKNVFQRMAALIIQREWRKYKGKFDPAYWNYLEQIKEAQKNAEDALNKVEILKKELNSRKNHSEREGFPIPKRTKVMCM